MTYASLEHNSPLQIMHFASLRILNYNAEGKNPKGRRFKSQETSCVSLVYYSSPVLRSVITGRRARAPPPFPNYVSTIVVL